VLPPTSGVMTLTNGASCAQAYSGEMHGHTWAVPAGTPPAVAELASGTTTVRYRLVLHPRTGRPARNRRGDYVYVPLDHSLVTDVSELQD